MLFLTFKTYEEDVGGGGGGGEYVIKKIHSFNSFHFINGFVDSIREYFNNRIVSCFFSFFSSSQVVLFPFGLFISTGLKATIAIIFTLNEFDALE